MKVAVMYGPGEIGVVEVERPEPKAGEVLLRVKAAGICGSDLHAHRRPAGERPPGGSRPLGGHEFCGTVTAVGEGVTHVRPGDRAGVEPLAGCDACRFCASGNYHLCPKLRHLSGGFSEYALVPAAKVFMIPESVSDEAAAILDCLAVGVHAVQRARARPGAGLSDTAVVLGDAAIGLFTMEVARLEGGPVGVVGHHEHSLAIARELGADFTLNSHHDDVEAAVRERTGGLGADVVYESVGGTATTLKDAALLVRPGGTIVVIGCFTNPPTPDWRRLMRHEVNVLFAWSYASWHGVPEFKISIDLLAAGKVRAEPIVTHRFPLDQVADAFGAALRKGESGATKVLVTP
jgi:2-desacetyl-2-hydroxyethyl bacteriochlorophyllide A dehydrogenase